MAPPNLKKLLQVKVKPRKDPYSDQFSRIIMVKMLLLTAAITGITWMNDKIKCIVPKIHDLSGSFVSKACWINGMYIYRELKPKDTSYYYGIPPDISNDGTNKYGQLCSSKEDGCTEMEKTFYLQYQWFPLAVAALGFIYYLPYLLYSLVNVDMSGLKDLVKGKKQQEVRFDIILNKYFEPQFNPPSKLKVRVVLNVLVKVLYIVANVSGLLVIDSSLNGEYIPYGGHWSSWTGLSNNDMHNYITPRSPKAGHQLLPGFGLCQVQSSGQDIKHTVINVHTYICEMSQHILYQYILIILWYMFIIGIIISILGLLKHLYNQATLSVWIGDQGCDVNKLYKCLITREIEYMELVRRKNLPAFGVLVEQLTRKRRQHITPTDSYRSSYAEKDHAL